MALDHSRLGLENKFFENKSGRIFFKLLPTNLGVCKPTFYIFYTSHLRWNSTIYHTDLRQNAVFHNFSWQSALSQYSGRSILAFSETVQKICKINIKTASRFSLLTSAKFALNINRVTLQHKEFIKFIFRVLKRCVILKSVLYARHFELTPASDVHERLKTNSTAIKIARETTNNNQ